MSIGAIPPGSGGSSGGSSSGGGGLVLLGTYTVVSGSASLNITTRNAPGQSGAIIQSDCLVYQIECMSVFPTTDSYNIGLRYSADGGATWKSGAGTYYWSSNTVSNTGGPYRDGTNGDAIVFFSNPGVALVYGGFNCTIKLYDPANTSARKHLKYSGTWSTTGFVQGTDGYGLLIDSASMNAFQFLTFNSVAASGTLGSGTFCVYGYKK